MIRYLLIINFPLGIEASTLTVNIKDLGNVSPIRMTCYRLYNFFLLFQISYSYHHLVIIITHVQKRGERINAVNNIY